MGAVNCDLPDVDFSNFTMPTTITATVTVQPDTELTAGCSMGRGQAALPVLFVLFGLVALAFRRRRN